MANLKEVRERIRGVKNTKQITSAMKMVSAAKLRRAQQAIVQMRPYAEKLNAMLRNVLSNLESDAGTSFNQERPLKRAAIVVVTSNRGLAGAFNSNVIKSAIKTLSGELAGIPTDVVCIGKKGRDYFQSKYADNDKVRISDRFVALFDDLSFDNTKQVPELIMEAFEKGSYDRVFVSYARFRNAAVQYAETEQFLPVLPPEINEEDTEANKYKADYLFEPSKEELLNYLVPSILQTTFHKYLLDTHASEHGARMTAMDKATENAAEMLRELKISYNKARQEAITTEILEIVGGAAALEDG
ncbi:MAG: ATP synthase F1 subunit gamma [Bacteroidota bacterium]